MGKTHNGHGHTLTVDDYRIIETDSGFRVDVRLIKTKGFFKKTVIEEWEPIDMYGNVWDVWLSGPTPPIARFKTLDEANEFIRKQVNPKYIVHKPQINDALRSA